MRAEIIAVGTELLLGQIANTNAQFLSQKLAELGINVYFHTVVGDNSERMMQAVQLATSRADLVILTGGLGPTQDDMTKETVAAFVKRGLHEDVPAMTRIQDFFVRRGITMTQNNRKQALVIDQAIIFPNDHGMAPGMGFDQDGKVFVLLPGPPSELYPMVEKYVMPFLMEQHPEKQIFHSKVLRFFGIGESALEERLLDLIEKQDNPTIAPYAKEFEVTLRITARAASVSEADELILPVEQEIRSRLGQYIYAVGENANLQEVLISTLLENNQTISCAESCTGGTLSSFLTSVSGSSAVFPGSIINYSNESKHSLVDIPTEILEAEGAVSAATAKLLAENVRRKLGSTHGISVTGVAGPNQSEGKPVGLIYIGLASEGKPTEVKELHLAGKRQAIIGRAAKFAMFYMLQRLKER
ncbi:competence/damage-inducible protein A [Brevibacillus sp. SYSU BS000544]|uniref:competence/damage-inducible protein A n=1 Tax=Brevibacillus sp. SYSU BS000544 TaxID=3416443 RepID=UPI003CE4A0D3